MRVSCNSPLVNDQTGGISSPPISPLALYSMGYRLSHRFSMSERLGKYCKIPSLKVIGCSQMIKGFNYSSRHMTIQNLLEFLRSVLASFGSLRLHEGLSIFLRVPNPSTTLYDGMSWYDDCNLHIKTGIFINECRYVVVNTPFGI